MDKAFFAEINIQQVPKPHPKDYYVRLADETSDPTYTVLGYEFTTDLREDSIGQIEGNDADLNFRRAFLPEKGHYWVSRDFSGQELRILANLSLEQAWVDAFLNGEDIHRATAEKIWGKENYDSDKRRAAKTLNFGLVYGVTATNLAEQLKVSQEEAQSYIDKFFEGLPNIKMTLDKFALYAQEHQEIVNFYGRKRRMSNYITQYGYITNAGKRRSYNFPVQSAGAEMTKLALIKLYHKVFNNPEYKDKAIFLNTIHDEINVSVSKEHTEEIVKIIGDLMYHEMPGKPVPIISGLEIGNSMGLAWAFKQDPKTLKLTPDMEPI